jgi:putative ABC transport system permease protein
MDAGFSLNALMASEDYPETLGLEMAQGRFFSRDYPSDVDKIVLNETAARLLGMDNPVGRITYLWNDRELPLEVIGVVKDYHWESKHMEIRPEAIMHINYRGMREPRYLNVRYSGNVDKVLNFLKEKWNEEISEIPFAYTFLDSHYEAIYQNERQTRSLLYIFAAISIFISCLGLFGLASFMAERRTKEIGIRKTNGASTRSILRLLTIDFTRWVLLANLLAWPITWLVMRHWLHNFAYRTGISWWVFLIAGVLAFIIALMTVSFHAMRAAGMNPGRSLRYE